MRARSLLVLAIVAALLGAPATAFAAGNELHDPRAEPSSGTVATVFALRVSYDGRFPAISVRAAVAGLELPMSLVSGTPTRGTWRTAVSLPLGTWPVAFAATSQQGNHPSLPGPTLQVLGSAPGPSPSVTSDPRNRPEPRRDGFDGPSPTPASAPAPAEKTPTPARTTEGGDGDAAPAAPQPTTNPSPRPPSARDAPGSPPGGAAPRDAPGSPTSGAAPGGGLSAPGTQTQEGDGPAADGPMPRPGTSRPEARGTSAAAPAEARLAASRGPAPSHEPAASVADLPAIEASLRVTAISAAVLLAFAAAFLGVFVRRRRRAIADAEALTTAAQTDAILRRRAVRRARVVLPEDPIVASLGLPDVDAGHRRSGRHRPGEPRKGGAR